MMTEDQLQLARGRLAEVKRRHEALQYRPSELKQELAECERHGDVEGAEQAEQELAVLVGLAEAARRRAEILAKVVSDAEVEIRAAASRATSAELQRERAACWTVHGDDHPPASAAVAALRQAGSDPNHNRKGVVDWRGGFLTPPITGGDLAR